MSQEGLGKKHMCHLHRERETFMAFSHKQMGNPAEVDVKSEIPEVAPPFFKGSKRVSGFMDQ